jgi:hypothetical protein
VDASGRRLVSPPVERCSEREQRVVEQHQPAVHGEADVGLEPVGASGEGPGEGGYRGVRAVGTPQAMRVERRRAHMRMALRTPPVPCYLLANEL